jgi:hypothetical protein
MTAVLTTLCGAVLLGLTLWALHQRRRVDPAQVLWLRATRRLARNGLPQHPWEGPQDYAQRIAAKRPEISAAVREIAVLYGQVRYGGIDAIDALAQRVAAFRP